MKIVCTRSACMGKSVRVWDIYCILVTWFSNSTDETVHLFIVIAINWLQLIIMSFHLVAILIFILFGLFLHMGVGIGVRISNALNMKLFYCWLGCCCCYFYEFFINFYTHLHHLVGKNLSLSQIPHENKRKKHQIIRSRNFAISPFFAFL